jgi:hypothetical protein
MTRKPGADGSDLAAELLADLSRPLPVAAVPEMSGSATSVAAVKSAGVPETPRRRPALEISVSINPLDWRKPRWSGGLQSTAISFGPVRAELEIR